MKKEIKNKKVLKELTGNDNAAVANRENDKPRNDDLLKFRPRESIESVVTYQERSTTYWDIYFKLNEVEYQFYVRKMPLQQTWKERFGLKENKEQYYWELSIDALKEDQMREQDAYRIIQIADKLLGKFIISKEPAIVITSFKLTNPVESRVAKSMFAYLKKHFEFELLPLKKISYKTVAGNYTTHVVIAVKTADAQKTGNVVKENKQQTKKIIKEDKKNDQFADSQKSIRDKEVWLGVNYIRGLINTTFMSVEDAFNIWLRHTSLDDKAKKEVRNKVKDFKPIKGENLDKENKDNALYMGKVSDKKMKVEKGGKKKTVTETTLPIPKTMALAEEDAVKKAIKDVEDRMKANNCDAKTAYKEWEKESVFGPKLKQVVKDKTDKIKVMNNCSPVSEQKKIVTKKKIVKEQQEEEPQEGDITISHDWRGGGKYVAACDGKIIAQHSQDEQIRRMVKDWMAKEGYHPNVFMISDHGNSVLINVNESKKIAVKKKIKEAITNPLQHQVNSLSSNRPVSSQKLTTGTKVKLADTAGTLANKTGTIVDRSQVKTNSRGAPTNVQGAYKPVDWNKEHAVKLDNGEVVTMYKGMVKKI